MTEKLCETSNPSEYTTSTREIQERIYHIRPDTPEKKRKKKIWNIIFILFNILVLVLVFIFNPPEAGESFFGVLKHTNGWYILAAFACLGVIVLSESLIFYYLIRLTTKERRPKLAIKTTFVGRYYDNVTPLATGGQPFQMYTMNKKGVPGATATSIPLVKYFTYMILYCIVGLYVLIFRVNVLNSLDPVIKGLVITFAWIGIAVNLVIPMFILLCSVIKPLGMTLLRWALVVGKSLRLVKDYGGAYLKAQKMLTEYQKSLKKFANFKSLFTLTVINAVTYVATAVIPYFIILAFTRGEFNAANLMSTTCMTIIVLMACSYFPAPGASGAAELSFSAVFVIALSGAMLPAALLVWRFITFYSFILIGIIIIIFDQIRIRRTAVSNEIIAEPSEVSADYLAGTMEAIQQRLKANQAAAPATDGQDGTDEPQSAGAGQADEPQSAGAGQADEAQVAGQADEPADGTVEENKQPADE